jgi:transcription initiation factor IIF auxiliary subunit
MRARCLCRVVVALALLSFAAAAAAAENITVQNTARFLGNGRYSWKVFLVAEPSTLKSISYVEYTLHPTFPNPVRRATNWADGFALPADGWGEFNILVKVVFKDRRKAPLQLTHYLSLQARQRVALTPDHTVTHGALRTRNTSQPTGSGRWDWQLFIEGDDKTLGEVKCVKYTLHPTFPNPVQTICARGSAGGRGFQLSSNGWGTFTAGVEIQFKDGDVRRLTHDLVFTNGAAQK